MPSNPARLEICLCNTCIKHTWTDHLGRKHAGALQRSQTVAAHQQRDKTRLLKDKGVTQARKEVIRQELEEEGRTILESSLFLSTVADYSTSPGKLAPERNRRYPSEDESKEAGPSSIPFQRKRHAEATLASPQTKKQRQATSEIAPTRDEHDNEFLSHEASSCSANNVILGNIPELQSLFDRRKRRFRGAVRLKFSSTPITLHDPIPELDLSDKDSSEVFSFCKWLKVKIKELDGATPTSHRDLLGRRRRLLEEFRRELTRIETLKTTEWEREQIRLGLWGGIDSQDDRVGPVEVDNESVSPFTGNQPWMFAALFVVTAMHTFAAVSREQCELLLNLIRVVIYGALTWEQTRTLFWPSDSFRSPHLTADQRFLMKSIPVDVRTVLGRLGVEPEYTLYACCPSCFALYPPSPTHSYPRACAHRETPSGQPCGVELLSEGGKQPQNWVPKKSFPYQSLQRWLGKLLLRPGIEDLLDKAWDVPDGGIWTDIMHAPGIQEFLGPDGKTRFSNQPDGSYHLVFSLFVDWFNPYGNKKAGKSHSLGAIYMACLNLPPDIRYRPENIFLAGIIPGPTEPSLHQLNHFLSVLVEELLVLWHRGIHVAKSARRPHGCDVFAAIIPLVCDLPAARKVAGISGHSSTHVCSFCNVKKQDLNNLDRRTWRRKTFAEHMKLALSWRDAPDAPTRNSIYERYGIRWTELLRLPYWDVTLYTVVDAMHNLYLGDLRHHCLQVLGLDVNGVPSEEKKGRPAHTPDQQRGYLSDLERAIRDGSETKLKKFRIGYLKAFADLNNVVPQALRKRDYIAALLRWREEHGPSLTIDVPPVLDRNTHNFQLVKDPSDLSKISWLNADLLKEIRADIEKTIFPSWMARPPRNFGHPSHGKLTADQWRSVTSISMVITLVRIWGARTSTEFERELLGNFLHLVLAVEEGTRKSMSRDRAACYDHHIYEYLSSLRRLFDHNLVPNHHMSLHLRECMERFGPFHSWWAFPFERYNGLISRFNTNHKPAEMPLTFLRYFCMAGDLRHLVSSTPWPDNENYRGLKDTLGKVIQDALRGLPGFSAFASQQLAHESGQAVALPPDVYQALFRKLSSLGNTYSSTHEQGDPARPYLPDHAQPLRSILVHGLQFSSANTRGRRNSYVLFRCKDERGTLKLYPGQIKGIYQHTRRTGSSLQTEPFIVLQRYEALTDEHAKMDLWRAWPGLEVICSLYYDRFMDGVVIAQPSDIEAHFSAYTYTPEDIGVPCILVRSLNRT